MKKLLIIFIILVLIFLCIKFAKSATNNAINIGAAQGGSAGTSTQTSGGVNIGAWQGSATAPSAASPMGIRKIWIGR